MVQQLIAAGHKVTVISSNSSRAAEIEALGATPAIGSVEDVDFLTRTFAGADVVYTMVPPTTTAPDWKAHIHSIGRNYAAAIQAAGIRKVVNLSSIGAHMPEGCGPVSGICRVEGELNALSGVDIVHLRPAFFYYNLLSNIGLIKHMGIMGGNYGENATMVMVHPTDIAAVAAQVMADATFTGKTIRYIASDERSTADIARIIGTAIGKPELPWVNFSNEDALNGMMQAGLSQEIASNYVEMGAAMASGEMTKDYQQHKPALSPTKLEAFAKEFAAIYAA
jgi:uncharacterized protein YbjT (DUF2867 family)